MAGPASGRSPPGEKQRNACVFPYSLVSSGLCFLQPQLERRSTMLRQAVFGSYPRHKPLILSCPWFAEPCSLASSVSYSIYKIVASCRRGRGLQMQLARCLGSVLPWGQENGRGREGEILDTRFAMKRDAASLWSYRGPSHMPKSGSDSGLRCTRAGMGRGEAGFDRVACVIAGWEEQGAAVRRKVQ